MLLLKNLLRRSLTVIELLDTIQLKSLTFHIPSLKKCKVELAAGTEVADTVLQMIVGNQSLLIVRLLSAVCIVCSRILSSTSLFSREKK